MRIAWPVRLGSLGSIGERSYETENFSGHEHWRVICSQKWPMQALRVVMLLVTVAICYLLFFYSQPKTDDPMTDPLNPDAVAVASPGRSPASVHSQYKEAMDRAHAAAKSMEDEKKEADSY